MRCTTATAFALVRVGNLGVGFDRCEQVIDGPRDVTAVRRIDQPTVRIDAIRPKGPTAIKSN